MKSEKIGVCLCLQDNSKKLLHGSCSRYSSARVRQDPTACNSWYFSCKKGLYNVKLRLTVWNPAGNHACFLAASENISAITKGTKRESRLRTWGSDSLSFGEVTENPDKSGHPLLWHHATTCNSCREAASSLQVVSLYDLHSSLTQWLCFLLTTWKYFSLYLLLCLYNHGTWFPSLHWLIKSFGPIFLRRLTSYHVLNKVKLSWGTQEDHVPEDRILKSKHNLKTHYSKE